MQTWDVATTKDARDGSHVVLVLAGSSGAGDGVGAGFGTFITTSVAATNLEQPINQ